MVEVPTLVDLFAGAGGLSLGFARAGFQCMVAFDNWPAAVSTYRVNLGPHIRLASICSDLELSEVPTVIAGGPPCQGFSSAGMRRSSDVRNTLVGEFARLIARIKPDAFLFENVEGFLTGGDGAFVFELLEPLLDTGYRIHVRKINAANFGVPQHRKRVVAIGGLGWDPTFPRPTHAAHGAPGAYLANHHSALPPVTLSEALRVIPPSGEAPVSDHDFARLSDIDLERARRLRPGECMRNLPQELWHPSYRKRAFRRVADGTPTGRRGGAPAGLRRLRPDEPSKAITGGSLRDFLHPFEDRPLTIRECAVLQTFPVDFQFMGSRADRIQLIGNAVPPRLAEVFARSLSTDLARNVRGGQAGALLSFVPTLSEGMSPALARVTERVEVAFGTSSQVLCEQLWP